MKRNLLSGVALAFSSFAALPLTAETDALSGKDLARHDFLYAGESKQRRAYLVKGGEVVWSYDDPAGKGEISDAVLLANGNLLIAHQYAVKLISPEKKVLWNLDAPEGTEIHTAMPIGSDHVIYVQNGNPAWVRVVNFKTGETKNEFQVPTGNPKGVHGQFRHGRLSSRGTLLLAHMDMGKVSEYDASGKELRSWSSDRPWGVAPLKNGNILVTERAAIRELTLDGKEVSVIRPSVDAPEFDLNSLQLAWRLSNGNTLVNNWFNEWSGEVDRTKPPVQAVEFTPDKKIVWVLRSWEKPDLGPSTTIQILDHAEPLENVGFGSIR
ncbi:hypothetical protein [Luteolibacter luteus]|uniref:Uncharacterized protein n=1 Tax=Luteolibacter luteus TaxID=2728835 RepID=A0A858RN51_9BACT|nr:hypothetical protein [Luteolibacter luteus]QJE97924.1 hypothetical protein HHL09_19750 [Luteolibacter luteus]